MQPPVVHNYHHTEPHYQVIGSGTPIVLIHGYMVIGEMFEALFEPFSKNYKLIVPDLRGYGKNKHLPGPYSIKQMALDIVQKLDKEGEEKAHIIGYSMGGLVTQQVAISYPERVKSIVLGCTFAHKPQTAFERMAGQVLPTIIKRVGAKGLARYISTEIKDVAMLDTKTLMWFKKTIAENNDEVLLHSIFEIFKFDSRKHLKDIKCPTLVVGAGTDFVVPVQHSYELARYIPGARIKVVENAGHGLIHTHPQLFLDHVRKFIAHVDATQTT